MGSILDRVNLPVYRFEFSESEHHNLSAYNFISFLLCGEVQKVRTKIVKIEALLIILTFVFAELSKDRIKAEKRRSILIIILITALSELPY